MTAFRIFVIFVFVFGLSACASTDVTKADIKADGKSSGVMVNVEGPYSVSQTFNLSQYDPQDVDENGRVKMKGLYRQLKLKKNTDGYVFTSLKPGKYVLKSLTQQLKWTACFHNEAIAFEAKPNEIAYIGTLRPLKSSNQLQGLAIMNGNTYARNSDSFYYMDNILKPELTASTASELENAKNFLVENAVGVELPLVATDTTVIQFQTGKSLFGKRVCNTAY